MFSFFYNAKEDARFVTAFFVIWNLMPELHKVFKNVFNKKNARFHRRFQFNVVILPKLNHFN